MRTKFFRAYSAITIAIAFSVFTSGCFTPKKMDGWIEQYEGGFTTKLKTSDYITVKTPELPKSDTPSVSHKGRSRFIPALIYWRIETSINSSLNPYIPVVNINSTILQYANSKKLREKLNGQKIELTISKVPTDFTFIDNFQMIYFVLYYVRWEKLYISPQKQDLVISYRILKDNAETKKGIITVTDPSKARNQKFMQSVKKMTWNYLEEYDNIIRDMSRQFVDKLLLEI
jgi:hypothetical protein